MLTKIQISKGISHYLHQKTLVEFRKMCRLISKDYIPYLQAKKSKLGYPGDKFSLIIMDTFTSQDNEKIKSS